MKFTLKIILFISPLFFYSCSSIFYSDELRRENNTIKIQSNYPNYKVDYSKSNYSPNLSNNTIEISKLNRKSTYLRFSHNDCYDMFYKIKRTPRLGAVILDLPLSIFYGLPFIIDVFRPDFYKIPKKSRIVSLQFRRTTEYFQRNILVATSTSKIDILDNLLKENPSLEIKNQIEQKKLEISKSNLYLEIKSIQSSYEFILESYNILEKKYINPANELKVVLDSFKLSVENFIVDNIKKNNNIFCIIRLRKISDASFSKRLYEIKTDVDKVVYRTISNELNFDKLDKLYQIEDSTSRLKLSNLRTEIEEKVLVEVSNNYNLALLENVKNKVSNPTKIKLDSLSKIINEYNKLEGLKSNIQEVQKLMNVKEYDKAIELINKIYPNSYSEESFENEQIKKMLIASNIKFIEQKILNTIENIKSNINRNEFPFDDINTLLDNRLIYYSENDGQKQIELKNNQLTLSQRKELNNIKKTLTKSWEIEKKKREQQNKISIQDNDNNRNNDENNRSGLSFCYSEMNYNGTGSKFKLTLFDGGEAIMNKNGQILSGSWSGNNGNPGSSTTVRVRINNVSLNLEAGYVNSMGRVSFFIDAQDRQWMECF
jgi:hypothetical protein